MNRFSLAQRYRLYILGILFFLLSVLNSAQATAPILFSQPAYQSPVYAEPDDLLLLSGEGLSATDSVVYQALINTREPLKHPEIVPTENTQSSGIAPIVSQLNAPNSLTIRLPETLKLNQSYAFWVRTADGQWSNGIKINDARPLWFSPAYVYASQSVENLPRYLKVIGRNLQPSSDGITQVKFSGPETITLTSITNADSGQLKNYLAYVALPTKLQPGVYKISVSRDRNSWIEVPNQQLEVRPDQPAKKTYKLDDGQFGSCLPDDGKDDTSCFIKAISTATKSGGGIISLSKGTWDLINSKQTGIVAGEGIRIPIGVSIIGQGSNLTTITRHATWNFDNQRPAFTLEGKNEIRAIRFHDSQQYTANFQAAEFLHLGQPFERLDNNIKDRSVNEVVITNNLFDKTSIAISDAGLPIKNLFILNNTFGAYHAAIRLAGNMFNMIDQFRIDDSIITGNTFYPGSWLDQKNRQGTLATEFGAGFRVDFSNNNADGTNTEFLNTPTDASGWRAGFFFHLGGNQEMVLVSNNIANCTGDKIGDGEAISFDNNGNTFGFDNRRKAIKSTSNTITIAGSLLSKQNNREIKLLEYYQGYWIQVIEGPGLGQSRKISSYIIEPNTQQVTFTVTPSWDVLPAVGKTSISIGKQFWQVYTVNNLIDHRQPTCKKSNLSDPKGGSIGLWAQTSDSVVEGNRQFDTDGIVLRAFFSASEPACKDCRTETNTMNSVEIRNNVIDGEYNWENGCSSSGIRMAIAAAPNTSPPTMSSGVSIAHNSVSHADADTIGAAIGFFNSWYAGPTPNRWPLIENTLIYNNSISNMWSSKARSCRNQTPPQRTGISTGNSSLLWHTVLYGNSCNKIPQPINTGGAQLISKICKPGLENACECQK